MKTSEQIADIALALARAQGEFSNPDKNRTVEVAMRGGGSYTFNYATFDNIVAMARPTLAKHTLAVIQGIHTAETPPDNDGHIATLVTVTTKIIHASGQWIEDEISGISEGADLQKIGSACTYLKRYSFTAMLGIVAEEDDDANHAVGNQARQVERAPLPACPKCGNNQHVIRGKQEYGGGYVCFAKKGGCGEKWQSGDEAKQDAPKSEPPKNGKAKADKIASEHGMTTADKLAPSTYDNARGLIDERSKSFEQLEAGDRWIVKQWEKPGLPKLLTPEQYADLNDRLCRRAIELVHFAPDVHKAKAFIDELRKANRISGPEQMSHWTSLAGVEESLTAGATA